MEVFINHQSYSFPENSTLQVVLDVLGISAPRGIALAVNNQVVPKSRWEAFPLQKNDKVILIRATQGG